MPKAAAANLTRRGLRSGLPPIPASRSENCSKKYSRSRGFKIDRQVLGGDSYFVAFRLGFEARGFSSCSRVFLPLVEGAVRLRIQFQRADARARQLLHVVAKVVHHEPDLPFQSLPEHNLQVVFGEVVHRFTPSPFLLDVNTLQ